MFSGGSRNQQGFPGNQQAWPSGSASRENPAAPSDISSASGRSVVWDTQLRTERSPKTAGLQNTGQRSHAGFHQIINNSVEEPILTNIWALPVKCSVKLGEGVYAGVIYTSNSFAISPDGPDYTKGIFPPSLFQYNCVHLRTFTNIAFLINDVGGCFGFYHISSWQLI